MSTTSFRLDDDLEKKLEVTADRLQRTKGWIIHDALRQYIMRDSYYLLARKMVSILAHAQSLV